VHEKKIFLKCSANLSKSPFMIYLNTPTNAYAIEWCRYDITF